MDIILSPPTQHRAAWNVLGHNVCEIKADISTLAESSENIFYLSCEARCVLVPCRYAFERLTCRQHRRVNFVTGVHISDAEQQVTGVAFPYQVCM